ncbi:MULTISPECIES: DNA gyrase inhibitor SbmC [Serratia]|jgi:DNA gyrase inhibitor|uniref:DNA gyrase inhibitor SbmC n=1 Tax=Serratia TaxID=613 RepID=UPI001AE891EC|nr:MULTISPECIES: DNA gyrase inhibitor SbmC [Serratia]MBP1130957.1 DNA gyrase inhibitor [Serratia sp. PL17]
MTLRIEDKRAEKVAGVRVVGPYPETVPQGVKQLVAWQRQHGVPIGKWLVLYWDDPSVVAPEQLRADVVFTVPDDFVLPTPIHDGFALQTLPAGLYGIYHVQITDGDFGKAWADFYQRELPASGYKPTAGVCYEHYLNDCEADGYFDLDIYQTVQKM